MRRVRAEAVSLLAIIAVFAAVFTAVLPGGLARAETEAGDLETAAQSSDPTVASDALFHLAERADAALDFPRALERYDATVARLPGSRWAPRAIARASSLRGHAEGGFAPLVRLERVRRDAALANDPAAIDALAKDAEDFPPGLVRAEARMLVAEAYLHRMDRTSDAIVLLRLVATDPRADVLTAREASRELVDALIAEGRLEEATETVREFGTTRIAPGVAKSVKRHVRQRTAHRAAWVDLGALAAFFVASLVLAARRHALAGVAPALKRTAPLALAFAAYIGVLGGWLASSYEAGNAIPFYGLAAAALVFGLIARSWAAIGSAATLARAGRAVLCASGVASAAFLFVERVDPTYLEGFGL